MCSSRRRRSSRAASISTTCSDPASPTTSPPRCGRSAGVCRTRQGSVAAREAARDLRNPRARPRRSGADRHRRLRLARSISRPIAALVEGVDRWPPARWTWNWPKRRAPQSSARSNGVSTRCALDLREPPHDAVAHRCRHRAARAPAQHDPLTGCRTVGHSRAARGERRRVETRRRPRALCFIDLDRFKIVNDTAATRPATNCCAALRG